MIRLSRFALTGGHESGSRQALTKKLGVLVRIFGRVLKRDVIDLDRRMFVGERQSRIDRGALRLQFEIENNLRRAFPFELIFAAGIKLIVPG